MAVVSKSFYDFVSRSYDLNSLYDTSIAVSGVNEGENEIIFDYENIKKFINGLDVKYEEDENYIIELCLYNKNDCISSYDAWKCYINWGELRGLHFPFTEFQIYMDLVYPVIFVDCHKYYCIYEKRAPLI